MMLQRVFKMCVHSLRHSNKRSTDSLPRLKYKMLPGHQLALFYIFITYCHGFNIFKTMFLRFTRQWLCVVAATFSSKILFMIRSILSA